MSDHLKINLNPSRREVRQFGLIALAFFAALGGLAGWRPQSLIGAATILSVAWLVSLIFNGQDRRRQLLGLLLPGLLLASASPVGFAGAAPLTAAALVWTFGLVISALAIVHPPTGKQIYVVWMLAALPIGWTVSLVLFGIVYYALLTPVGVAMRLFGRDPLNRKIDPDAASYWIERPSPADTNRYFRQF